MTGAERRGGTLGDRLRGSRRSGFVGRSAEVELFRSAVRPGGAPFSVLYVHGPGGIGKSSLLDRLAEIGEATGATVVRLDGRDLQPTPAAVLEALDGRLEPPPVDGPVRAASGAAPLVLLVDTYERLAPLDDWVRDHLLPRLPASAVAVVAGRDPPAPAWRADPAWRELSRVVSLRNLGPDECRTYLRAGGVAPELHEPIVRTTFGHPLGLSLLVDLVGRGEPVGSDPLPPDLVQTLLQRFVGAVPGARHRRALEVCALARTTTAALLRDVLGGDDTDELFGWLRGLSFVETGAHGLHPHDLARDALDADLRWRDPAAYRETFRGVRAHVVAGLRATSARAQQAALFELKFLFRQLRSVLSPVEWESWGEYYPDRARPQDRDAILELVRVWEGTEAAALAARWFESQPAGFWVIRGHDGAVRGLVAIVDLAAAPDELRAADPGARAAWEFAQRTAPPRPHEALTQCRFVVDREVHQRPSPTLNATPILTLQRQLSTPDLSWDFLVLAEPDRWDDYFAAADLPRAAGADFSVGGRRYGLFAHDFRAVPVEVMTERWTERALARDVTAAAGAAAPEPLVLSHPDFDAAVRQGLRDLRRPDLLARNPLRRTRVLARECGDREPDAAALADLLRTATATLAEHPRDDKLLRAVERTYLRPAATQEAAAAALGLPFSTYRRHLARGVARVVECLWDREIHGGADRPRGEPARTRTGGRTGG